MNHETENNMISKLETPMKTNSKRHLPGHPSRTGRAALAVLAIFALCLGFLRTAQAATVTNLFEGFEGSFPSDNGWTVGDANATGTNAWWDDVNNTIGTVPSHSGSWKGYSAGVGFAGTAAAPLYQPYMDSYMRRTLDLRTNCSPFLNFWYRTPGIETCCDHLVVSVGGTVVFSNATATANWNLVSVNLSAWGLGQPTLEFLFHSDFSGQFEGVYLDDIQVTSTPATATIFANVVWGSQQDTDGDGCLTATNNTFRLIWDPDISCAGTNTMSVFEKIYRRTCGAGAWTLYHTTADHIITGTSGSDQQYLDIPATAGCACYDYAIEVYRTGQVTPDAFRDPSSNPILGGHREELLSQETATIFSAYFSNQLDRDGDGCWAATNDFFRIIYDVDVVGGSGILNVFEKVYYRQCGAGSWTFYTTTPNHAITNGIGGDSFYVDIGASPSCACYDYRIETYRVGQTNFDFAMDSSINANLAGHKEEYSSQDWPTVKIFNAYWSNQSDTDGDGCWTAPNDTFRLVYDPDLTNCELYTVTAYEKVYSRPTGNTNWTLYTTTANHLITNCLGSDSVYVDLPAHDACSQYDYKIELYRLGHPTPDFVADPSNFPALSAHKEELQREEKANFFTAYWAYQQDSDGDGCWASTNNTFRLVYDPDVVGCYGSLTVFEKVYYQTCGSGNWNLSTTTTNHVISGCPVDLNYVDIPAASGCACYNYMIEIYRAGQLVPDQTLSPTNYAPVLANHREELYLQDECSLATATVFDAWWSYQVDTDGDSCWEPTAPSGYHLNWDPDVSLGGICTLSVYEKVYLRQCGSAIWSLFTTNASHTITGLSIADQQFITMPAGPSCACYEYKIEVYRTGQVAPDYTRDPTNDLDLANHHEEALGPRPPLTITRAGNNVVISWPVTFTGFTLQSASALPPGTWSPVGPAPVIVGSQWNVTNAIGSKTYYRLVNP